MIVELHIEEIVVEGATPDWTEQQWTQALSDSLQTQLGLQHDPSQTEDRSDLKAFSQQIIQQAFLQIPAPIAQHGH